MSRQGFIADRAEAFSVFEDPVLPDFLLFAHASSPIFLTTLNFFSCRICFKVPLDELLCLTRQEFFGGQRPCCLGRLLLLLHAAHGIVVAAPSNMQIGGSVPAGSVIALPATIGHHRLHVRAPGDKVRSHRVAEPVHIPTIKACFVYLLATMGLAQSPVHLGSKHLFATWFQQCVIKQYIVTASWITLLHPCLETLLCFVAKKSVTFAVGLVRETNEAPLSLKVDVLDPQPADLTLAQTSFFCDSHSETDASVTTFVEQGPREFHLPRRVRTRPTLFPARVVEGVDDWISLLAVAHLNGPEEKGLDKGHFRCTMLRYILPGDVLCDDQRRHRFDRENALLIEKTKEGCECRTNATYISIVRLRESAKVLIEDRPKDSGIGREVFVDLIRAPMFVVDTN